MQSSATDDGNPGSPRGSERLIPKSLREAPLEQTISGVFRISDDLGTLTLLVSDFGVPNGLAFTPDKSILHINDSRRGIIRAFNVQDDGTLALHPTGCLPICVLTRERRTGRHESLL